MPRLQNEVGMKIFSSGHEFSHEKCSETFPKYWAGSSDIFYFCPSSKGRGWGGSEGRGNFSKIRGKRGTKRGGEEGSMQEKGRGHLWGGGVLNIYFAG